MTLTEQSAADEHAQCLRRCFVLLECQLMSVEDCSKKLRHTVAQCHAYVQAGVPCEFPYKPRFAIKAYVEASDNWSVAPDGADSGLKDLFRAYVAAGHIDVDKVESFRLTVGEHRVRPLRAALQAGRLDLLVCLVEAGVDETRLSLTLGSIDESTTIEDLMVSLPMFRGRSGQALALLSEARMRRRLALESAAPAGPARPEPPPRRRRTV